ncbi:uncharacterized protein LOC135231203 [Loxodonta africana]|uniref:uncharacterized protein LOC135231203 n=1 Tax=Loxodonta africana TaxID=9785 RepID=UPI0030D2BC3E
MDLDGKLSPAYSEGLFVGSPGTHSLSFSPCESSCLFSLFQISSRQSWTGGRRFTRLGVQITGCSWECYRNKVLAPRWSRMSSLEEGPAVCRLAEVAVSDLLCHSGPTFCPSQPVHLSGKDESDLDGHL